MNIPFWKMHGAGNDFVLIHDAGETFPCTDPAWIARVAARRTGVGCEGVILIQPSEQADFRMRFFNPDGNEVEMCGNGARCVARLAHELGVAPARMAIDTVAGVLRAEAMGETVLLTMSPPKDCRVSQTLDAGETPLAYSFVNTGVPHVVVEVEDLEGCDVRGLGSAIRYHSAFAPAGTNANFIHRTGAQSIAVRTYERGVEDETLACGTGIVASALIGIRLDRVKPPVTVTARSGDTLVVDVRPGRSGGEDVTLLGPAEHVFQGTLVYEDTR
jgi:diaminopimelate epimerase